MNHPSKAARIVSSLQHFGGIDEDSIALALYDSLMTADHPEQILEDMEERNIYVWHPFDTLHPGDLLQSMQDLAQSIDEVFARQASTNPQPQ